MSALDELIVRVEREHVGSLTCAVINLPARRRQWALDARHLLWLLQSPTAASVRPSGRRVGYRAVDFAPAVEGPCRSTLAETRCRTIRNAMARQLRRVSVILAPLAPESITTEELIAYVERFQQKQPELWHNFEYLFRDWAWNTTEMPDTLQSFLSLLPDVRRFRRLLVPGAGACRLAYDLHRTLSPEITIATDIQPLLLLCASRLVTGRTLGLYEFPRHPLDLRSFSIGRRLRAPHGPVGDGFHIVLTDIDECCLRSRAFDCIVTSWFIDAVPIDIHRLFALINELLCDGGVWVNVGPTMFVGAPARIHSAQEVFEAVPWAGFSLDTQFEEFFPYFVSPTSATRRSERVLGFRATKQRDVAVPEGHRHVKPQLPDWLEDFSRPVEIGHRTSEFAKAHRATAEVLEGAELHLSVAQIAERIAERFQLSPDTARSHTASILRTAVGLPARPAPRRIEGAGISRGASDDGGHSERAVSAHLADDPVAPPGAIS